VHRYVLEIAREKLYWRGKYFLDTSPFCRPKQTKFCVQNFFFCWFQQQQINISLDDWLWKGLTIWPTKRAHWAHWVSN
jgi:hypothetical protein